ncbi:hypothetical protein FB446DRAFT_450665 [Lentinula raphanica]|nr:hypothetical protein FB446DRAFT_450665 [Lentinula raphanica]
MAHNPPGLMRYLTSSRTPSMRLLAYLLFFFGCASNLYTAALPVTDAESVVGPSATVEVMVEWTTVHKHGTPINAAVKEPATVILEKQVTDLLRLQYGQPNLAPRFTGEVQWISNRKKGKQEWTYFRVHAQGLATEKHPSPFGKIEKHSAPEGRRLDQCTLFLYAEEPKNNVDKHTGNPLRESTTFDLPFSFILTVQGDTEVPANRAELYEAWILQALQYHIKPDSVPSQYPSDTTGPGQSNPMARLRW